MTRAQRHTIQAFVWMIATAIALCVIGYLILWL